MTEISVGGDFDWGLAIALIGTLIGAALGWVLNEWSQGKRFAREQRRRERLALAELHLEIAEARFQVDQMITQNQISPNAANIRFTFPSFRHRLAELDSVFGDAQMGEIALVVAAAEDMTAQYQRKVERAVVRNPADADQDLKRWLDDLDSVLALLKGAMPRYNKP